MGKIVILVPEAGQSTLGALLLFKNGFENKSGNPIAKVTRCLKYKF
jgi:hypothetical protein